MKLKYFYFTLFAGSIFFIVFTAFRINLNTFPDSDNKNIIKFSHKVHSQAVECDACHINVSKSTSLKGNLYPDKPVCATCHDVEDNNDCSKCHYDGVFEKLQTKKPELIFNHSSHISGLKMNCSECHIGLAEVDYSAEAPQHNPDMAKCYTCHNDMKASNNCELCHISTVNLLPQTHKIGNFNRNHKLAISNENCQMCHDDNFCSVCHTGTSKITENNTAKNFFAPYVPYNYVDGAKQQKLTRVHDLNYVYSHGIDAKSKSMQCNTCHQSETFCSNCHNGENQNYQMSGNAPVTHKAPDFVTIGVGTGGGQHALLAKRDIERCSSCHDLDGGDPVCTICHIDNDGIKGTNPKTHKSGYMKDIKGDWHDSKGSLCYTCHTSGLTNKDGQGFCGYCHSKKL